MRGGGVEILQVADSVVRDVVTVDLVAVTGEL
jgi:hypothetical protein